MATTTSDRTSPLKTLSLRPEALSQLGRLQAETGWSKARLGELAIAALVAMKPDARLALNKKVPMPRRKQRVIGGGR